MEPITWRLSHRGEPAALKIADKHYSRQKPGTPQFVKPGRCIVFMANDHSALWVTSWPYAQYVKHEWAGAWENSLFHRITDSPYLARDLIEQAVAVTRFLYGPPPELGIITIIDPRKVRSTNPGYCYQKAGWKRIGTTKAGLPVFGQTPDEMPDPAPPYGYQTRLVV